MKLNILATGSAGNLYTLTDGKTSVIIEAGLNISSIKRLLNFRLTDNKVCLLTHEHVDHARGAEAVSKYIPVVATKGTLDNIKDSKLFNRIEMAYRQSLYFDTLKVTPFETIHNAQEPCGYLIKSLMSGKHMVFVTDSQVIPYQFDDISYLACECNYDRDILEANVDKGVIDEPQYRKIVSNHLSLDTIIEVLKGYDKLEALYLLHGSDRNLDRDKMIRDIREVYKGKLYDKTGEIK
jgi:phosphoribosyl 1,2-cyclic phosphodiesterase